LTGRGCNLLEIERGFPAEITMLISSDSELYRVGKIVVEKFPQNEILKQLIVGDFQAFVVNAELREQFWF